MELIAAGAEHLAAFGVCARADFEECVAAIFVVFDRKALENPIRTRSCGHTWVKRIDARPVRCPNCQEHDWGVPAGKLKRGRPPKRKTPGRQD